MWHLALVYVAFGFSYIIYATYFAKYLEAEAGCTKEAAGNPWAIVGWISIFCGLIWGTVSDRIGRKHGLALVYLLQAISFATFALWRDPAGYTVSSVLFGLTAWSIPGIVAAACGDSVGDQMAPAALGFVTLFFGLGQAAGPLAAGGLAETTGSFGPVFLLAAGIAVLVEPARCCSDRCERRKSETMSREQIRQHIEQDPFARFLGIELLELREGYSKIGAHR